MMYPTHEPACRVRAHVDAETRVRLYTRNLVFHAEGQTSLAAEAAYPSALDYLLSALGSDLVTGFTREAARAGIAIDAVELSLSGWLENPLVALGVVGEPGSPALNEVRGSLFVSTDAAESAVSKSWQQALAHAPVYSTLSRGVRIDIALQLIA